MTDVVLDTHAFSWWVSRPKRLGREAARILKAVDQSRLVAWIPAIVGVELALLSEAGRRLAGAAEIEMATARHDHVKVLPMDLAQAREFALLQVLTDPFDRMIVAAARATGCRLVSADARIADSGLVEVVWS